MLLLNVAKWVFSLGSASHAGPDAQIPAARTPISGLAGKGWLRRSRVDWPEGPWLHIAMSRIHEANKKKTRNSVPKRENRAGQLFRSYSYTSLSMF